MATVKIRIYVRELTNVMLQFNCIKVYRCVTRDGVYAEITAPSTRPVIVSGTTLYEYIDTTAPSPSYWYKTAFYHSVSLLESSLSDPMQGVDAGLYCTLQDIRDEGVSVTELSDDRALRLIRGWQAWIDKATGQFFTPVEGELLLDGDGTRLLLLPYPIITCTALYANDDFVNAINTDFYVVYNGRSKLQDDRRNPHIVIKRSSAVATIFNSTYGNIFEIGDRNQKVVGTFGYTEDDGSVPQPISDAVKILVIATKEFLGDDNIDQLISGRVTEEVTDRHRITFTDLFSELKAWNPTGITAVDLAIRMYRSPTRIVAPRTMLHPLV